MKLTKFLVTYKPQNKHGAEVAAIAAAGAGVVGSIISSEQSSSNVRSQLAAQREENQKNRDYMTAEAEKARSFTSSERQAQQSYQTEERIAAGEQSQQYAKEMADINAMYNSPVYQSQELRKAGINPQVYFGQSSSFAGSSQGAGSAPFGSAPTGAGSPMPGSPGGLSPVGFQPIDLQIPALQQGVASLVKAATDKSIAPAQINDLIASAHAKEEDAKMKSLLGQYQVMANQLFKSTLPMSYKKAVIEVEVLKWQVENAKSDNDRIKVQTALNRAEERLKNQMEKLTGQQAVQAQIDTAHYEQFWTEKHQINKSQAAANNASAALSSAQAQTENEFRDFRRTLLSNEADVSNETKAETIQKMLKRIQADKAISEADKNEAVKRANQALDVLKGRNSDRIFKAIDDVVYMFGRMLNMSVSTKVE